MDKALGVIGTRETFSDPRNSLAFKDLYSDWQIPRIFGNRENSRWPIAGVPTYHRDVLPIISAIITPRMTLPFCPHAPLNSNNKNL